MGAWGAIIGGIAGGALGGAAGFGKAKNAREATKQLEGAFAEMKATFGESADLIEQYSKDYTQTIQDLTVNFDPYDVEAAFGALYEAIIKPMERDFDENVLPGIQAAYSGGVMGQGAGLSGASMEAEASARRGLSENKAQLKYQERDKAIDRNIGQQQTSLKAAGDIYQAKSDAPLLRADMASQLFGGESDVINTRLAAKNAKSDASMQALQGAQAGMSMGSGMGGLMGGGQQQQTQQQPALQARSNASSNYSNSLYRKNQQQNLWS